MAVMIGRKMTRGLVDIVEDAAIVIHAHAVSAATDAERTARRNLARELRAIARYHRVNPLGGPASMLETAAARIRVGEPYHDVLADYGLQAVAPTSRAKQNVAKHRTQRRAMKHLPKAPQKPAKTKQR